MKKKMQVSAVLITGNHFLSLCILIYGILAISGCSADHPGLKDDAGKIAAVMCRSIGAMRNLKSADPADSLQIAELQAAYDSVEAEMTVIYADFRKKWGEKISDPEFGKEFRKYLNEAMLDCTSLSKEDRDNFEREPE